MFIRQKIKSFIRAFAIFGVLLLAVLVLISWCVNSNETAVDNKITTLAREFAVGHPNGDFISRARDIGAFDYAVVPGNPPPMKTEVGDVPPIYPEWNADAIEPGGKEVYEAKLDIIERKFKTLTAGSASIMLMVTLPFGREGCHIDFRDGKVTAVRIFTLD